MPRNRQGGSLASYFYDAAGDSSKSVTLNEKNGRAAGPKSLHLPASTTPGFLGEYDENGIWIGPGPEPKKGKRRRTKRSGSTAPAPRTTPTRKEINAHIKTSLATMKEHYKESELIFEANKNWPLSEPYTTIEAYISECKGVIHDARTHEGVGKHKKNLEAVHSARIDTTGWDFDGIHDSIVNFPHQAYPNHLKLAKPHHHKDGTHLFVNVVLSWLFAAKSQLMSNIAVYVNDQGRKTDSMVKFLHHSHKGKEALNSFHHYKKMLPPRKPKGYILPDRTILDEQYQALYG